MCTRPISIKVPYNPYEYSMGYRGFKEVIVPCGKCPECLMKRQKDISVRAFREAKRYGTCFHVILTYDWKHVPFSHTLLDYNLSTGEVLRSRAPGLEEDPETLDFLRKDYRRYRGRSEYYYYRHLIDIAPDLTNDCDIHRYEVLYTPTLSYRDFSLKMKNFRADYQRKVGKLDFGFVCVGEYGSDKKHSHRPHFHVMFFGLSQFQLDYFKSFWIFGHVHVKPVKYVNEDGSSGIAKVAAYIGKYAAKGSFVPNSVKNKYTLPCRLASSRKLGLSDLQPLIDYYRCYDLCKYDIELCDYPADKRNVLFSEIIKRLKSYVFEGSKNPIALPHSLVKKIFNFRTIDGKSCWSKIYYEVMDFARSINQAEADRVFSDFIDKSTRKGVSLSASVAEFEAIQDSVRQDREYREKQNMSRLYSH